MATPGENTTLAEFERRIRFAINRSIVLRMANQQISKLLTLVALLSSGIATILVSNHYDYVLATDSTGKSIGLTAVLTGLPAALLALGQALNLSGRALFFNANVSALQGIYFEVKYEGLSVVEGSRKWRKVREQQDERWARVVATEAQK